MPLALVAAAFLSSTVAAPEFAWLEIPDSRIKGRNALRIWAPRTKPSPEFHEEGYRYKTDSAYVTQTSGQAGRYVFDMPGFHVKVRSGTKWMAEHDAGTVRKFVEELPPTVATRTGDLVVFPSIATLKTTEGVVDEKDIPTWTVIRYGPQPMSVNVSATPENWLLAEECLKSLWMDGFRLEKKDYTHPVLFLGRGFDIRKGEMPVAATRPNGFGYRHSFGIESYALDVQREAPTTVDSRRALFLKIDVDEALRFGLGSTWHHLKGTLRDGRPGHIMATRVGAWNYLARVAVPVGSPLRDDFARFNASQGPIEPNPLPEKVEEGMFERNVIVRQREFAFGGKPLFRVDAFNATISNNVITYSEDSGAVGTIYQAAGPFDEKAYGLLEYRLATPESTYLLRGVRPDGTEVFAYDFVDPRRFTRRGYVVQRPDPTPLRIDLKEGAYGDLAYLLDSMRFNDPVKGWTPVGRLGNGLAKGFAYNWVLGGNIEGEGLWVSGVPQTQTVRDNGKHLWRKMGGADACQRFTLANGKLLLHSLVPHYDGLGNKAEERIRAWAESTGVVAGKNGRWEKTIARGKPYEVYKTTVTRDGAEHALWYFLGPEVKSWYDKRKDSEKGGSRDAFMLEFAEVDAASRDGWLRLNEEPPSPPRNFTVRTPK